jgi:isopentenyl-diphosphate Delta-isomerase
MELNQDVTAEERKKDHIQLALNSQTSKDKLDSRFNYEPCLNSNTPDISLLKKQFLGINFNAPLWVSSMTGGTKMAATINENLARLCNEFGLGMGLGSCRRLLYDNTFLSDFDQRKNIGDRPMYANLGIAQVEQLIEEGSTGKIAELLKKLQADGLIIHINPLQEYMQPEGDRYKESPIVTIDKLMSKLDTKYIVKEVGHGMGPKSIAALMQLPLQAIEFAAFGGTNFSVIELGRSQDVTAQAKGHLALVGHTVDEMIDFVNDSLAQSLCKEVIISGGISNYLDGYYYLAKSQANSVFGMASGFLKYAMDDYDTLKSFTITQLEGLAISNQLLTIKR